MQIDTDLLIAWGGISKIYQKNEMVFSEGNYARFYFQMIDGCVKMANINDDGKEFVQGVFYNGESFGEPPLFLDESYPASAIAIRDSVILKISKESFLKILKSYPSIQMDFLVAFSKRIFHKSRVNKGIALENPEHRILGFLDNFKKEHAKSGKMKVPFTRQEIANFTGLRVETVIRALSKMNKERKVSIVERKLYY